MSLKIAYILKMYPRFSETFIVNEILELERRGIDVRIYSLRKPDDGRFHAKLAKVKAHVVYVPQYPQFEVARIREAHALLRQTFPERYADVLAYTERRGHDAAIKRFLQAGYVAAHLHKHPVHAMHAHFATSATRVANLVHQLTGLPYSVTAHAKDIFHESVRPASLRSKLAAARFVVTVSQFNKRYLHHLMGNEQADIRCLYNGIDLRHFRPNPTPPNAGRLLAVGRLVEKKGFHYLIDACAILKQRDIPFRCDIIGKGEWRERLQNQIDTLGVGDRVRLVGARPQDQVQQAYHDADLFVLPCVIGRDGNRDGLPTVLLEAMASGLPAVTTTVTGNPEIVDHAENGLLVPPNDADALADALATLLQNDGQRHALAQAARVKVEAAFDVQANVAQLHAWLAEPVAPLPQPSTSDAITELRLPTLPVPTLDETLAAVLA